MKRFFPLLMISCMLWLTACQNDIVYSQFNSISSGEWHMDSIQQFDYQIADTSATYTTTIYVRHTENYPYQNMWLFVGDSIGKDTIQFMLADERGNWLGDKKNGMVEMPVVFGEKLHFIDSGRYHLSIQQGMRDTILRGVMDIGLEIRKDEQE